VQDSAQGGGSNVNPPAGVQLMGNASHDLMLAPAGTATVAGLDGIDTLLYGGARDAYTITKSGADVIVSNGAGLMTTLNNVERLQFSDQAVALDTDGNAGDVYRLYQAAFNRAPDKSGLGFWIDALDTGHGLHEAAQAFVTSNEFAGLYGANTSDAQFLQTVYQNVLHRAPDASGFAYWMDALQHIDRAQLLVDFSKSNENQANVSASIQDGIAFTPWNNGDAGKATVLASGARSDYTVVNDGGNVVISNGDGATSLGKVERIQFGDLTVALDTDGKAGDAYRLYQAAFNRAPDKDGLGFWIKALDGGQTLHGAAEAFVTSNEFAGLYGANTSDAQFLQAVYQNVLHRVPDADGYGFWLDAMQHVDRAQILVDFSGSNENQAQVIGSIQNGIDFTPFG
jgi:hypothetical protein